MNNLFDQTGRFLKIITTLPEGTFLLTHFAGIEQLSSPFNFKLTVISYNTGITSEQIIRQSVTVVLQNNAAGAQPRYFNGIISAFVAGDISNGVRQYELELSPTLYLLAFSSDCRIFQNQNVIDILMTFVKENNFDGPDYSQLTQTYKRREFCVQYRETALAFIERILREEGIFYYFRHEYKKHTLVLADQSKNFQSCVDTANYIKGSATGSCINNWNRLHSLYSGKYQQNSYNYQHADQSLITHQQGNADLKIARSFEIYDFPDNYDTLEEGNKATEIEAQALAVANSLFKGQSNYLNFAIGKQFKLNGFPDQNDNTDYALITVTHLARDSTHLGNTKQDQPSSYHNQFVCLPLKIPFRLSAKVFKPLIFGAQTAKVVGGPGTEINTRKYACVRVQFQWDRKGNNDDYSSGNVRVAQLWAGKNWGTLFMPRVGHEVVVQFINGNPDQPIIVGSVYNDAHQTPYSLPGSQTKSVIRTCSSKGGNPATANELSFEDEAGSEQIFLRAQKDLLIEVENNETITINKGNQQINILQGSSTLTAAQSIEFSVGNNRLVINSSGIFVNGDTVDINQHQ